MEDWLTVLNISKNEVKLILERCSLDLAITLLLVVFQWLELHNKFLENLSVSWVTNLDRTWCGWLVSAQWCLKPQLDSPKSGGWTYLKACSFHSHVWWLMLAESWWPQFSSTAFLHRIVWLSHTMMIDFSIERVPKIGERVSETEEFFSPGWGSQTCMMVWASLAGNTLDVPPHGFVMRI